MVVWVDVENLVNERIYDMWTCAFSAIELILFNSSLPSDIPVMVLHHAGNSMSRYGLFTAVADFFSCSSSSHTEKETKSYDFD